MSTQPSFDDGLDRLETLVQQLESGSLSLEDALARFQTAIRDKPDFPAALNDLAWILATDSDPKLRSGAEAVRHARRACDLTHNQQAALLMTLSAACAEAGRFPDAINAAQTARDLAATAGQKNLAVQNEELLRLYRAGRAFRESR